MTNVVLKQSIRHGIVSYLAVGIGAVSTLFIYPLALREYGLIRFIIDSATLLAPFAILGIHTLPVRFYPKVENEQNGNSGFLKFILLLSVVALLFFAIVFLLVKKPVINALLQVSKDNNYFEQFAIYILPVAICLAASLVLVQYLSIFKRIVVPAILNNLLIKVCLATIVLLFALNIISVKWLVWILCASYLLSVLGMLIYLQLIGKWKWSPIQTKVYKGLRKELVTYGLYSMVGGVGTVVAFRLDSVMVSTLVDLTSNGAYNIGLFMANAIAIPTMAIYTISGPIISKAWENKDTIKIGNIYQDASTNLLAVGCLLFILIITSLGDLITIMPENENFRYLFSIVGLVGFARLFDMVTSVNNQIILYSKYYKFNLIAVLLLAFLNIYLNILFIKTLELGIVGAAIATALSIILYNIIKLSFIYWKFDILPFSASTIKLTAISIPIALVAYFLPLSLHPILNILLRSLIIGLLYIPLAYQLKVSTYLNNIVESTINWLKK